MRKGLQILFVLLLSTNAILHSQDNPDQNATIKTPDRIIANDSRILEVIDSLSILYFFSDTLFTTDTSQLNVYNFEADVVPEYPDSVYQARIEKLNQNTPIELTYNKIVKNFIGLYTQKRRHLISKVLGLSALYFPMFEEQLDRFDIPLEMKYLAIVESGLNPTAGSHAGAKGLWQFMYYTGKLYGLKVNSLVDERFDPLKSTIAACTHMRDLYEIYEDWNLVMAAYNSGVGNVNKAMRRAGGTKSYWAIWPFLPRETRGYVPGFIAVTYLMNHTAEHNLYPMQPGALFREIDTVTVNQPLSFDQIYEMLGIPLETLELLNPQFKAGLIPAYDDLTYSLRIPYAYSDDYVEQEKKLYEYVTSDGMKKQKILAEIKKAKSRAIHKVKYGESLSVIAEKYHCRVSQLKSWNNLRSDRIYAGQKLIVYSPDYVNSLPTVK